MTPSKEAEYVSENNSMDCRVETDYPKFCALVYSLDMFVPLVNLHQANYWLPNANKGSEMRILKIRTGGLLSLYMWVHIIVGWILTTLFVVGLTGLARR